MGKVSIIKGMMFFFPDLNKDGYLVRIKDIKEFYLKLTEYVYSNVLEDTDFYYQGTENGLVTIWCHHHFDERHTDVYLVGIVSGKDWHDFGWWDNCYELPVRLRGNSVVFPDWLEKILSK